MDANIFSLARLHWRKLIWMWIFPLAFLGSVLVPAFSHFPFAFFFGVDLPAFFGCYYMASKPVRRREITAGQGILLIVVIPFIVWATVIFGLFGLARLAGISSPGIN